MQQYTSGGTLREAWIQRVQEGCRVGGSLIRLTIVTTAPWEGVETKRTDLVSRVFCIAHLDMRKSMPKDVDKRYIRSNGRDILVSPEQVWA